MLIDNDPVHIPRNVYNLAIGKYVERVKNVPGVLAVALIGSVNALALSDIDVITAVEDDFDGDYAW